MSIANLYAVVSANIAGALVLVIALAYLSWKGVVVSGKQYEAMEKDRDFWRERTMTLLNDLEPRLSRMADEPPAIPAPKPTAPPGEVTP